MLLYAVNHDDDEIQQVSRTEDGKRWWFFRGPGGRIFKWRKNYLEGAFFANGVEAALETWKDQDPDAFGLWARSIKNEVLTNFLPVAGVVPYEVVNNQRGFFGGRGQIVSDQELQLDPAYQVGNAGTAERVVGKATGISPAIINHVIRGYTGYFGENAVRAVSAAIDWHNTDELPPLEDLPMTQRVVSRFPAASTKSIHEFYQTADEVGIAAHTLAEAERSHPADIPVMLEKYSTELQMTELFNDARKQIADLRRASEALDGFDLGPKTKSEYRNSYLRQIIEIAEVANSIARAIKNQTPAAAAP
jgi:hypothetical protein